MIDIHKLRIFTHVYRLRGFSRASEELYISQPTVSEHIRGLEDMLNARLFDRLGREVIPTEAAHILNDYAEKILSLCEEAIEAVRPERRALSGKLFIGGSTIPGEYILPELIAGFKQLYPEVETHLTIEDTTQIVKMLEDSLITLAIVGAQIPSKKIEYIPFMTDRLILVAKRDLSVEEELSAGDLPSLPLIFRERGSGTRLSLEKDLKRQGISPEGIQPVAVLGSSDALKSGIKAGMGVGFISHLAVRDEVLNGTLKEIKIHGVKIERQFYIIRKMGATLPETCKTFSEFIQSKKKPDYHID